MLMVKSFVINTVVYNPDNNYPRMLDMSGRCAFAICTKGKFEIKILNDVYTVEDHCLFACMPFVDIKILKISEPSEVVFGYILIQDVPRMINRWINSNNLTAIQNHPLIVVSPEDLCRLMISINEYQTHCGETNTGIYEEICNRLQEDIIDLQSRLIIAQVLKLYFSHIHMKMSGPTHHDIIFQRFMLTLYANFREHRDVQFYASRSGVSLKYFSTIIRQLSGVSPSKWIETVVVSEVKGMLNDNNRSIKDIAASLNFPDTPTFTKYFLRVSGITPKVYRKTILYNS